MDHRLKVTSKTIKLLGKKTGEKHHDLRDMQRFFFNTQKVQKIKILTNIKDK